MAKVTLAKVKEMVKESPSSMFTREDVLELLGKVKQKNQNSFHPSLLLKTLNETDLLDFVAIDNVTFSIDDDRKISIDYLDVDIDELYDNLVSSMKELEQEGFEVEDDDEGNDDFEDDEDDEDEDNFSGCGPNCKCNTKKTKKKK